MRQSDSDVLLPVANSDGRGELILISLYLVHFLPEMLMSLIVFSTIAPVFEKKT